MSFSQGLNGWMYIFEMEVFVDCLLRQIVDGGAKVEQEYDEIGFSLVVWIVIVGWVCCNDYDVMNCIDEVGYNDQELGLRVEIYMSLGMRYQFVDNEESGLVQY